MTIFRLVNDNIGEIVRVNQHFILLTLNWHELLVDISVKLFSSQLYSLIYKHHLSQLDQTWLKRIKSNKRIKHGIGSHNVIFNINIHNYPSSKPINSVTEYQLNANK